MVLAGLVLFADETFYGLRPHAVKQDLKQREIGELLVLAENGPIPAIVTYDAWYEGRSGQTGWFILPTAQTNDIAFGVNGALDPALSKMFGADPRRCGGTGLPEKMIRAIEPDRTASGFLGRSTCKRAKMDLGNVIAQSKPAERHSALMDWETLTAFDAAATPFTPRDAVDAWPTPYAYYRTIALPLVWRASNASTPDRVFDLRQRAQTLAETLNVEGHVGVRLTVKQWGPQQIQNSDIRALPFAGAQGVVLLRDVEITQFGFTVLCALQARDACNAGDVSELMDDVLALRDINVWDRAVHAAVPAPNEVAVWRDVLRPEQILQEALHAPKAQSRQFSVTWYDASAP